MTDVFDLQAPLPNGRLAIEASAGTGKTFTLAGLATRFVAEEGTSIDKILIVTFTRAAAAELRERVRARLVEAVTHLASDATDHADPLLAALGSVDAASREVRLNRVSAAVAGFDDATITTIHGFAQQVLATLGTSAPGDPEAVLVEDTRELAAEVCADLLVRRALTRPSDVSSFPSVTQLRDAAMQVLTNPEITVLPPADPDIDPVARLRGELVREAAAEVVDRRRRAQTLAYDDLLTGLRSALGGRGAAAAVNGLRERFSIALIDEFQDTDPVQWAIFDTLFAADAKATGPSTSTSPDDTAGQATRLILVGDPKQAIYAFRGANVHTYLDAAHQPGTRRSTLGTNWRSDAALIDGLDGLLGGATFGTDGISFLSVDSPEQLQGRGLQADSGESLPPVELRCVNAEDLKASIGGKDKPRTEHRELTITLDVADHIRQLLDTAELPDDDAPGGHRPVRPSDVAVLVLSHREGPLVQDALAEHGIPAVINRVGTVFDSVAADHWRWLLHGLARPSNPTRARTAALSWLWDASPTDIDRLDDDQLAAIQTELGGFGEQLSARGVGPFVRSLWSKQHVTERLLSRPNGERDLTDLEHIGQLLHERSSGRPIDPSALLGLLEELSIEAAETEASDSFARRIESDDEAVQILTVYASKGLEFGIVCCPYLWRGSRMNLKSIVFQDHETGARTFDAAKGIAWPDKEGKTEREGLARDELVGESLRLAYVALTRAKHQLVVWWTKAQPASDKTGLGRILFARGDDGRIDPERFVAADPGKTTDDRAEVAQLADRLARVSSNLSVSAVVRKPEPPTDHWRPVDHVAPSGPLDAATLDRSLNRARRRWSFSAISATAEYVQHTHLDPTDDTGNDSGASDEPTRPDEESDGAGGRVLHDNEREGAADIADQSLVLGELRGGTELGTLVHLVLERADFRADDLDAELATHLDDLGLPSSWMRLAPELIATNRQTLLTGLRDAIESPLGSLFGSGVTLASFDRPDRLDELDFDFLVGGASGPLPAVTDIGTLLLEHLPDNDPLRGWASELAEGLFTIDLAGHLTGSIDGVLRRTGPDGIDRFFVIDYKSNWLGPHGRPLVAGDYHPDRLPGAMADHHYPLQAILYSVALHRYLRWRVRDYDPAVHLGGAGYLFLRGMTGASTPVVDGRAQGTFTWQLPPALVVALSDLLAGTATAS